MIGKKTKASSQISTETIKNINYSDLLTNIGEKDATLINGAVAYL